MPKLPMSDVWSDRRLHVNGNEEGEENSEPLGVLARTTLTHLTK